MKVQTQDKSWLRGYKGFIYTTSKYRFSPTILWSVDLKKYPNTQGLRTEYIMYMYKYITQFILRSMHGNTIQWMQYSLTDMMIGAENKDWFALLWQQ